MKTRLNKGFTLIELLVVIAIIGILSGIVLTSLNTARTKAKAAAVQASLSSLRAGIAMCCDDPAATLGITPGAVMCTGGSPLPTAAQLQSTGVTYAANAGGSLACSGTNPGYTVTITGGACSTAQVDMTQAIVTCP